MKRATYDVHVTGLSAYQVRSLAATLSTAAIAADSDPAQGALLVPGRRNTMFEIEQIETVIREWVCADDHRDAVVIVVRGNGNAGAVTIGRFGG